MKIINNDNIKNTYELIIIGWGAAAFAAAIKAQELNIKDILMVGFGTIGGTCVNVGCVPSKFMLNAGESYNYNSTNKYFQGISLKKEKLNYKKLVEQKNRLVLAQRKLKYQEVVNSLENVEVLEGKAKFISKNTIKVNNLKITGKNFIIATGSKTFIPPVKGINNVNYLTNIEALNLTQLPKSMIILGASTLGLEFAQMFNNFGTKITLLQRSKTILSKLEPEISKEMKEVLENEGINIITNANHKKISENKSGIELETEVNNNIIKIKAEKILIATGRVPNTENLGLENTEIKLNKKSIIVNEFLQTTQKNIYAGGDVIGEPMLETVAGYEGSLIVNNLFTKKQKKMDFETVPYSIFSYPQLAGVGLTQLQAEKKGLDIDIRILNMVDVPKAEIIGKNKGLIKMIINRKTSKILGCHIMADHGSEIIQEVVLALKYGFTIDNIIDTMHIFPTLTEAIKLVCMSFKKDLKKLSCCT